MIFGYVFHKEANESIKMLSKFSRYECAFIANIADAIMND